MSRSFFSALSLLTCACTSQVVGKTSEPERPNIILIMSDDMGFSDIGCYGGEAKTPNLDSLAANGVRFTQFYNNARCCPTRASLLTGLYPHQAGIGHMMEDRGQPGYRGDLNRQCVTIAEVLGDAGYRTYAIGKWHLTRYARPNSKENHNWPLQRGFEKYYGTVWGAANYFDPGIWRGNETFSRENDPGYKSQEYYFTNALSDNSVSFLREHAKESPDKPFFMYVAYTAAHWPMQALEKDIAKYKGRFDAGYDKLRKERLERLKAAGLIDPKWDMTPTAKDWDKVKNREWELRCIEVYAAMIDCMDQGIGRIVEELKTQNQLDNTIILFLQDNGGCAEEIGRQPQKKGERKARMRPLEASELSSGGHPRQTRDGRIVRSGPDTMPGPEDTYLAYGLGWANVSNTPFREYKHWVHEGGISTPLIVHWPKGIPQSRRNKLVPDPTHLIDIMATCIDVAQTSYPAEKNGEKIKPVHGVSLRPVLEGNSLQRKEPIFWEHEENRAVRDGKWKLVSKAGEPWELYDIDADRTEMHNVAAQNSELVRDMSAKWEAWAKASDVLPLGTWKLEPGDNPTSRTFLPGQVLSADESPDVGDRLLTVTVTISAPPQDGVLAAQGGTAQGFALYVLGGKLCFDLRKNNELVTLSSKEPLDSAISVVSAALDSNGSLKLLAADKELATKEQFGLLGRKPGDGLSIGTDSGDQVGTYPKNFDYKGQLKSVTVQTGRRAAAGSH